MNNFNAETDLVSQAEFRAIVGSFASGVTIISCEVDGQQYGATASSFTSLSLEPPMVLVCLNRSSRTAAAVTRAGTFAVSILGDTQAALAAHFAGKTASQFSEIAHHRGSTGDPVLDGAHAALACEVESITNGGTHAVFLSRVVSIEQGTGLPLLYHRGSFGHFSGTPTVL